LQKFTEYRGQYSWRFSRSWKRGYHIDLY